MESLKQSVFEYYIKKNAANVEDSRILDKLIPIKFQYMKSLKLAENNLQTIETLCKIFAPLLENLWMCRSFNM